MKTVYHIKFKDRNLITTWQYLNLSEFHLIRKIINDHCEVTVTKVKVSRSDYNLYFNS